MQYAARTALTLALLLVLAACKPHDETAATPDATAADSSAASAASDATAQQAEPKADSFDIDSVPVSTVTLGDFPYVTLPAGYTSEGRGKLSKDFARFPFWVNGQSHWVEGKFYGASFAPAEGKSMSEYEVKKNFETLLRQMGGVKLSEGRIPSEVTDKWGDEITQGFIDALGDVYNDPVTTYLVRRNDGNIWVHLVTDSGGGAYLVGQEKAFAPTAQLLPTFPYIALPTGYTSEGRGKLNKDFARFPFWVKGQPQWIEGKFYGAAIAPAENKDMSEFEVRRNFEALIQQMGGQKMSEEKIPSETVEGWGDEIQQGFIEGLGDVYNEPATTYFIRRDDGNVWVHLVTSPAGGNYLVGQEKAFAQTAQLLPASALKQQLDSTGKVALQVNFATDKTDILPDSLPQIDQVVRLLQDDATLQLAINGHTDNTGDASHNQKLSEGRANAVVAAIVGKGIDGARLSAQGFGQTQPVADNATEEGKAKNRRVELVKKT